MNSDQVSGILRQVIPPIVGALVAWGLIPAEIADQVSNTVITTIVSAVGVAIGVMAVWSWWSNRSEQKAKHLVDEVPGVKVIIPPNAPEPLTKLAEDPAVPGVEPARR